MNNEEKILSLWRDIDAQKWDVLADYFHSDAAIYWHNTDEKFTVSEFITANSHYPGSWAIEVERIYSCKETVITAVCVRLRNSQVSFHAASFFEFKEGMITRLHEYWGDDGPAPKWRRDMGIGESIAGLKEITQ